MKPVRQSLLDYDFSLLNVIAQQRNAVLDTSIKTEAVDQLTELLLSPVDTAIITDHLPKPAKEALSYVLHNGGQVDRAKFVRRFGSIRPMGTARLERERPWEQPVSTAEILWYLGFIYKGFQVTQEGGREMTFIPTDMQPLLASFAPENIRPHSFQLAVYPTPAHIIDSKDRLRENFFNLLVYLQTTPVRLQPGGNIPDKNRQELIGQLLPQPIAAYPASAELDFLLHLGQRSNLLTIAYNRLKPDPEPVKRWLQADVMQQNLQLQNAWRADPTWNDLWHVPGLSPQPTGWENSPLRARSKILGYLEQVIPATTHWFSIDDFITAVKQTDPDFQRPDGNYESWYIKDEQDNLLMGFKHWDNVEGTLIRYFIAHILFIFDAVHLGTSSPESPPDYFQFTRLGIDFLRGVSSATAANSSFAHLRINNRFQVRVPAQSNLYDRFQLARFADLEQREPNRIIYRITQTSFGRALKNGVTHDQVTAFLTRSTQNNIPLKVIETLRAWGTRYGTVKLEQVAILRLEQPSLATELQRSAQIAPLLGEALGPTTFLIAGENVGPLRKLLKEMGYMAQ